MHLNLTLKFRRLMEYIKNTRKLMFELFDNVGNIVIREERKYSHFLNLILKETFFSLEVPIDKPLEEYHMRWTTYEILNC